MNRSRGLWTGPRVDNRRMTHPTLRRRLLLGSLSATLLPACAQPHQPAHAVQHADLTAALDAAFRPLMAAHDIPGMAAGVTVGGRTAFVQYGVASRASGAPVTPRTLFEIGSLSKTLTATLACHAQAVGALSLADAPSRFVPGLRGSALDRATLLHLGTYTAGGLPLQFPDAVTLAGLVDYYRQWTPDAAPGAIRRYSNPSIGLLGHITALALKRDFADVSQGTMFPALGLHDTFIRVPAQRMADYAWGYRGEQAVRVNPGVLDAEAYGVKATAADLLRLVQLNLRPQSLPTPWRQAVADTHAGHFAVRGMVQGLGWEQYPYPVALDALLAGNSSDMALQPQPATALAARAPGPATLFNKTGSTNGFGGYAAFVPGRDVGIVMLANRNIPIPTRITAAHAVLGRVVG